MADRRSPNAQFRCFAACWPDEATRSRLDRAAALAHALHPRARRVRRDNLHLTLAFIGELPEPSAQRAAQALRGIELEPFAWTLDHIGRFERARVLWASGPAQPHLAQLAERVRGLLRDAKIDFDRKAFAAHVTLLRDLPPGAHELVEPIEAFAWPIHAALLLVSEPDARGATVYRVLDPR